MVTLAEIRDYLKTLKVFNANSYYIGRIDAAKKNVLGVYSLKNNSRHKCIGNAEKCEIKGISLLVHGDTNKDNTEKLANKLYAALDGVESGKVGGKNIQYIELLQNSPIDVDTDSGKIYEYVIEVNFYLDK